ncbi:E3 ubiquitin-protein ligase TRIM62 [Osmerus eperlanus]|uniref:E3 ubiquitin-protein ligase TRIM62 n=1 Tax=Osmerus eperlanus TaxID=29151 RepID=UPI002E13F895
MADQQSILDVSTVPSGDLLAVAPCGDQGVLQEGVLDPSPTCFQGEGVVQPFPRSPKLLHKLAESGKLSEKQLSRRLEELQEEKSKAKGHIQSLKKRRADLSWNTEMKRGKVMERFEGMRTTLKREEQAVLDSLELDRRETSARLDKVLKGWDQHLALVQKSINTTQKALGQGGGRKETQDHPEKVSCHKKADASEAEIRLNEDRFEKHMRALRSISNGLKAQFQRKTLLLDSCPVVIDRQTKHSFVSVAKDGRDLCFWSSAPSVPEHPLQFDKVCCALGSAAVAKGRGYWEVDVRYCSVWAVGVAYGCLERKGRDKGAKLGRNRNSWCVEFRDGHLSAWHNDHHMACHASGRATPLRKVGVWVNYEKGHLAFYDADTMKALQEFSAALNAVFDRAHHQFTEPLYPAVRFLRPPEGQVGTNHMQLRDLSAL